MNVFEGQDCRPDDPGPETWHRMASLRYVRPIRFRGAIDATLRDSFRGLGIYRFSKIVSDLLIILAPKPVVQSSHCEERSDEPISILVGWRLLRALPSQ